MSLSPDFRSKRQLLPDDAFALVNEQFGEPTALIAEPLWRGLMSLPDDVVLRTTAHQGPMAEHCWQILAAWVEDFPIDRTQESFVVEAMMDVADALQASTFSALHGYYRQGLASLRGVLEVMLTAASFAVRDDRVGLENFRYGPGNNSSWIQFSSDLDIVARDTKAKELSVVMGSHALFQGTGRTRSGWIWGNYQLLSRYLHAIPGATDGEVWMGSNGPRWVPEAFVRHLRFLRETFVIAILICKIADPELELKKSTKAVLYAGEEPWVGAVEAGLRLFDASP